MVEEAAMRLVSAAFDGSAASYDADFSHRAPGRRLRAAVWGHVAPFLRPGMQALDLGCGTGEDAVWLATAGCRVTAADASPAMLEATRYKAARSNVADRVRTMRFDINAPTGFAGQFDLVLSNFGALNCATDLRPLGVTLRQAVAPGGVVALNVMGRFCAWEFFWHGLHWRRSAFRRWRGHATADIGGNAIPIRYWSSEEISKALGPDFQIRAVHGCGVFLPPSYLFPLVERRPRLFERLARWEARFSSNALLARMADHQLTILRRDREKVRP
jgi:SAM-dependent methyltransferase